MVALGDTAAPDAAKVACEGEGMGEQPRGRWGDGMRWVAEFANALPDIAWPETQGQARPSWPLRASANQTLGWQLTLHQAHYARSQKAATLELLGAPPLVGGMAKVKVRAPFLPATLLLSVEREGVFGIGEVGPAAQQGPAVKRLESLGNRSAT